MWVIPAGSRRREQQIVMIPPPRGHLWVWISPLQPFTSCAGLTQSSFQPSTTCRAFTSNTGTRWAESSFNCFDNWTFLHLSALIQHLLKSTTGATFHHWTLCESKRIPGKNRLTCDFDGRRSRVTKITDHQTSRTLPASSLHLCLSSTLPLSPSYIIRFAALLSLPAAFVFPSSSSSSYFIPWIITPLTSELNTFIANQLLLHATFCVLSDIL